MAKGDGHINYATLDRVALAGIDQYSQIKTVRVEDDGRVKVTSQMVQDVRADTNNTSAIPLNSGATFTGTATSTLGVVGIQVSLKTDTNCKIYVDQSNDGTNWDLYDEYDYFSSINNFGITVQAIAAYVRVRVTNTSLTNQTYLRMHTVLCPVVETLPRSLDKDGYLKVAQKNNTDHYGFDAEYTPMGEQRVAIPTRLIGANFEGNTVDSVFWTATVANDGTVAQANSQVKLSTNTTSANGSAKLHSTRRARYVSGIGICARSVIQVSAGATDNRRRWGIAWGATMPTYTDGAFFQLDGTEFSVVIVKGTVEAKVASGSFNGVLGSTWVPGTTVRTYEIYWTNSKVWFVIGGDILHTVSASTATWANTMNFHAYLGNVNSNGAQTNSTLECRVISIRRLGALQSQPTSYYFANGQSAGVNLKLGSGNLHGVIVSNAANNAVITLSDSTSAGTPIIWSHTAGAQTTSSYFLDFKGLPFYVGLRLIVASANAQLTVIYE